MIELTTQEFYTLCLTIAGAVWLLQRIFNKGFSTKNKSKKSPKVTYGKKKFIEKKWTPDGRYYDEKKQKWIEPDYPQNKQ